MVLLLVVLSAAEWEEGPMEGEAMSTRDVLPKGAVLAPVAPSRRGREEYEDL